MKAVIGLMGWVLLCFGAAAVGAHFTPGTWYAGLAKPAWNPPNWIFAPVWTLLYTMMGISAWLVWKRRDAVRRRGALTLFLGQLLCNALWSWLFFGLHRPGLAFAEIVWLWVGIVLTLWAFRKISWLAAGLLLPYLAWVSFAAVLNFALWRLNP